MVGDRVMDLGGEIPQRSCIVDLDAVPDPKNGVEFPSPHFQRIKTTPGVGGTPAKLGKRSRSSYLGCDPWRVGEPVSENFHVEPPSKRSRGEADEPITIGFSLDANLDGSDQEIENIEEFLYEKGGEALLELSLIHISEPTRPY